MKEEIRPLGAGSVGGIKLILDAHTMTNRVLDYKKGFFQCSMLMQYFYF